MILVGDLSLQPKCFAGLMKTRCPKAVPAVTRFRSVPDGQRHEREYRFLAIGAWQALV
jgi:hypothetical protein